VKRHSPYEQISSNHPYLSQPSLVFENLSPAKHLEGLSSNSPSRRPHFQLTQQRHQGSANAFPFFEPFTEPPTPAPTTHNLDSRSSSHADLTQSLYNSPLPPRRMETSRLPPMDWRLHQQPQTSLYTDWRQVSNDKTSSDYVFDGAGTGLGKEEPLRSSFVYQHSPTSQSFQTSHEVGFLKPLFVLYGSCMRIYFSQPINFLSLLHPSSSPPYHVFVGRIIKSSDQQASIFLQQKLKVADLEERAKIVDAICARGFEMMAHRYVHSYLRSDLKFTSTSNPTSFGNWAVQRCLEAASTPEERRKIVSCMRYGLTVIQTSLVLNRHTRGRVVDLATNCYGCHVLQKALDCEEDIRLLIVSELLLGDPAQTLVNKHASHVWSKVSTHATVFARR